MRKSTYIIDGRTLRVEVQERSGEHLYDVKVVEESEGEDRTLLEREGLRVFRRDQKVEILGDGTTLSGIAHIPRAAEGEVNLQGCRYLVKDADIARDGSEEEEEGSGPEVTAPMPGRVVKVLVEKGVSVGKGTALLIVESMKMETEIQSGIAGTVSEIHRTEGDNVNPGDILLTITPES